MCGKNRLKYSNQTDEFGLDSFLKNTKNRTKPIDSSLIRTLDSLKTDPNWSNYTPVYTDN
jgi:hypothetical protein